MPDYTGLTSEITHHLIRENELLHLRQNSEFRLLKVSDRDRRTRARDTSFR